jgi:hypothetical protein
VATEKLDTLVRREQIIRASIGTWTGEEHHAGL